jgi:hypothetical protein
MAFNPIMNQGTPLLLDRETKVIELKNVFSTLQLSGYPPISRDEGSLTLTNARIIFINKQELLWYRNFALHLDLISDELFLDTDGKIFFQGSISPYSDLMPSHGKFIIELNREESYHFKGKFLNFIRQIKIAKNRSSQNIIEGNQAFVDPYNPDILQVPEKPERSDET